MRESDREAPQTAGGLGLDDGPPASGLPGSQGVQVLPLKEVGKKGIPASVPEIRQLLEVVLPCVEWTPHPRDLCDGSISSSGSGLLSTATGWLREHPDPTQGCSTRATLSTSGRDWRWGGSDHRGAAGDRAARLGTRSDDQEGVP